ncbi:hypothetical protein FRB94_002205 [Tulasnella sp. JGI-2019a]|nr:hypothetical protein FRB94_002205 [Tulasnella sp. JGI-2019a]
MAAVLRELQQIVCNATRCTESAVAPEGPQPEYPVDIDTNSSNYGRAPSRRGKFASMELTTIASLGKPSQNTLFGRRTASSSVASSRPSKRRRCRAHMQSMSPPPSANQDPAISFLPQASTSTAAMSYEQGPLQHSIMPSAYPVVISHPDLLAALTSVRQVGLEVPIDSPQNLTSSHDSGTKTIRDIPVQMAYTQDSPALSEPSAPMLPLVCPPRVVRPSSRGRLCATYPSLSTTIAPFAPLPAARTLPFPHTTDDGGRPPVELSAEENGDNTDMDPGFDFLNYPMEISLRKKRNFKSIDSPAGFRDKSATVPGPAPSSPLDDDFVMDLGATSGKLPRLNNGNAHNPYLSDATVSGGGLKSLKRSYKEDVTTSTLRGKQSSPSQAPLKHAPPPNPRIYQPRRLHLMEHPLQKPRSPQQTQGIRGSDSLLEVSKNGSKARSEHKGKAEVPAPVAHQQHHHHHYYYRPLRQLFQPLPHRRRTSSVSDGVVNQKLISPEEQLPSQQSQGVLTCEVTTKIRCIHIGETSDVWIADYRPNSSTSTPVKVAVRYLRRLRTQEISAFSSTLSGLVQRWKSWNHPHIMPLLDHGHAPHSRIVTPWYSIGSLSKQPSNLSATDRNRLLLQIADGLAYLHTNPTGPVVHGNIKPGNIYLDDSGNAKIGGFESSLVTVDNHQHVINSVVQDVRYRAPELLEADQPSTASDIYALALVGVEILSGKRPFDTLQAVYLAAAVTSGLKPSMDEHLDLSGRCTALWPIFEQMWDKDPLRRPDAILVVRLLAQGASNER